MTKNDKMLMGISLHSYISSYLLWDSEYFDIDNLSSSEIVEVKNICVNIAPNLDTIKKYFEVVGVEQWINEAHKVDCILRNKKDGKLFLAEWKIRFNCTTTNFRYRDLKQLLNYLEQIKSIHYGLLCSFSPIGNSLFYFTDTYNRVKVVSPILNDEIVDRISYYGSY